MEEGFQNRFPNVDTAQSAVNGFLQEGNPNIHFIKGNFVFASKKNMHIFREINSEGRSGVLGQYFHCEGFPTLKCTAQAVGQYAFDKKSIQRINAIKQNYKNGSLLVQFSSASTPSSFTIHANISNSANYYEEKILTIQSSSLNLLPSPNAYPSRGPEPMYDSSVSEQLPFQDYRSAPSPPPACMLDSLVCARTPETSNRFSNSNSNSDSSPPIDASDWLYAEHLLSGKRTPEGARADTEFRRVLNEVPPSVRAKLLPLWEQYGPQSASIRRPTFSLSRLLLASRPQDDRAVKNSEADQTDRAMAVTASDSETAKKALEDDDCLSSEMKNLKIAG